MTDRFQINGMFFLQKINQFDRVFEQKVLAAVHKLREADYP